MMSNRGNVINKKRKGCVIDAKTSIAVTTAIEILVRFEIIVEFLSTKSAYTFSINLKNLHSTSINMA